MTKQNRLDLTVIKTTGRTLYGTERPTAAWSHTATERTDHYVPVSLHSNMPIHGAAAFAESFTGDLLRRYAAAHRLIKLPASDPYTAYFICINSRAFSATKGTAGHASGLRIDPGSNTYSPRLLPFDAARWALYATGHSLHVVDGGKTQYMIATHPALGNWQDVADEFLKSKKR